MIPLIEFQERSLTGPVMKTDDFDLSFSMRLRKLVEKHNIKYDLNVLIVDDKTADAVFHAGVELLADIGLYHLGTQRVIKISENIMEEIEKLKPVTEPFVGTPRGSDIYDSKTITPKPEYLKLLDNGKNRLTRLGVPFEH